MIHLDTHIVVWTYARRGRLSTTARGLLAREDCQISPAVVLEIEGLFELARISADAEAIVSTLGEQIALSVSDTPFLEVVNVARSFAWSREPFDRLIVANAMADGVRLLTADEHILRNFKDAVW